jgi:DNA-binding transcriptional LysR family regulator
LLCDALEEVSLPRRGPQVYAEVDGHEAMLAMVALGYGVGVVPDLVRKDSPLRGRIEPVEVKRPPRGYLVSLCAKPRTLTRRTAAVLWELAPSTTSLCARVVSQFETGSLWRMAGRSRRRGAPRSRGLRDARWRNRG